MFEAAGFKPRGQEWIRCSERVTASRQSGRIAFEDLNADGTPEAWVSEGSTLCYGNTAAAFVLLAKDQGHWVILLDSVGLPRVQDTKTKGWPNIEVGLPGIAPPPRYGFNGTKYERLP